MNLYTYLAIDIGASSGRHILGWLEDGQIRLQEVHRFSNGAAARDGHLCWDVDTLFAEIIAGLKNVLSLKKFQSASALTPGAWTSFCWTGREIVLAPQWHIVTTVLRGWTQRYTDAFRKLNSTAVQGSQSSHSTRYFSSWPSKPRRHNILTGPPFCC